MDSDYEATVNVSHGMVRLFVMFSGIQSVNYFRREAIESILAVKLRDSIGCEISIKLGDHDLLEVLVPSIDEANEIINSILSICVS